jgi:nitroreductase
MLIGELAEPTATSTRTLRHDESRGFGVYPDRDGIGDVDAISTWEPPSSTRHSCPGLHPLLAHRRSPTSFDESHSVEASVIALLLEAARWAPSAGNSQPWSFIVGVRGDDNHDRLVRHLARSSARWASTASALIVNLCHRLVAGTDWEYSEFAQYDLGQAVAHMTVQAGALGLQIRQFRAFDRTGIETAFGVPAHWEVTTMCAIGRAAARGEADDRDSATGPRERRPIDDLLWPRSG